MRRTALLSAALLLVAWAIPAGAMMIKVPLGDLTGQSASVLHGRVTATRAAWTPDNRTIETEVTIAVDAAWKGAVPADRALKLRVPGGEVGEVGVMVEHAPLFATGEDVVVFLEPLPEGGFRVSADEQGKYTVVGEWIIGYEQRPVKLSDFRSEVGRYAPAEGR